MKRLFITSLLAGSLLLGTTACGKENDKDKPASSPPVEKPVPPEQQPTPIPQPAPQPAQVETTRTIQEFVSTFNRLGKPSGYNLGNMRLYKEDQATVTYNGTFSNGLGFGMTVYKSNGNIGAVAVVGSDASEQDTSTFYATVGLVILSLDPSLGQQGVMSILEQLGLTDRTSHQYTTQAIGGTLTVTENNRTLTFQAVHN
ncbi:adhesin [Bacillus multifaciens]|uniref:adhesin n=1 Tax=Bacillus multifaciens TaxID=3068506 RepID=UPI0027413F45|nr:adhesin [Bacillus sp. WLY-B-L8]MDP7980987.1 adhesin [Bacillus sp. WLY-B-L8]